MSTVSDYTLANQGFSALRTELNSILGAINTLNSTTSAPGSKAAGSLWLDTTSATTPTLKFYDGSDWISLCTFNYSANTVNWLDNTVTADVSGDSSPQLGGELDVVTYDIVSTSNRDIDITPHGTGDVVLGADTVKVGDSGAAATLTSNGAGTLTVTTGGTEDLILNTNNGTNAGNITLADGANGNIDVTTNGTGAIKFNDMAYVPQQALTSTSNAVAWDSQSQSNAYYLTTENTTIAAPTNAVEGAFICLEINHDGSYTVDWNAIFNFAADTAPTTTDTNGKTDLFVFRYNGSIWQEIGRTLNIPES